MIPDRAIAVLKAAGAYVCYRTEAPGNSSENIFVSLITLLLMEVQDESLHGDHCRRRSLVRRGLR